MTRALILIGFLVAAVGFGMISSLTLPSSWTTWSSYEVSQLVGFLATALFCALFGWSFWVWLRRPGESYGRHSGLRPALRYFAAATSLLTVAYTAEAYQLVQHLVNSPYSGRGLIVVAAGYSVVVTGFGTATVGYWAAAAAMPSDGANRPEPVRDPRSLRVRTGLIAIGLLAGGAGWVVAIWPNRVADDGATSKSVLIFGFANAAALVVMTPGFRSLLLKADSDPEPTGRVPLSMLGFAFLSLVVSNLAFFYQDWRVFSALRSATTTGLVLQCAGALAASVGLFASAWAAGTTVPDRATDPHLLHGTSTEVP